VQVRDIIRQQYSDLEVVGFNYPATPAKRMLSQTISYTQFGVLGMAFLGDRLLPAFGVDITTPMYVKFKDNRLMIGAASWFIGNTVSQSLMATGAFEVAYDGNLIFSKLKSNRLPTGKEILEGMIRAGREPMVADPEDQDQPESDEFAFDEDNGDRDYEEDNYKD